MGLVNNLLNTDDAVDPILDTEIIKPIDDMKR